MPSHPHHHPLFRRSLSVEEVTLLLQAAPGPKYKAAFATTYGAGLRVSEVVALTVADIDSERMLLRVEQGKGRKDRHAMLSPQLLELLRERWREGWRLGALLPGGYDLLFRAAAETLLTIPADPRHPRRPDRHHRGAPHLGLGDDPPSARPHDRAGRRNLARQDTGCPTDPASCCR